MSYREPEQLRAYAAVLEKAADRLEAGTPRWTSSSAFCNYMGKKPLTYGADSPTGGYAPLAALTFAQTNAEQCEACVMGACVAVCTLDLSWAQPDDAALFLGELEQWLAPRAPRPWDNVMAWNDQAHGLSAAGVVAFLRGVAAEAHTLAARAER